MRLLDGLEGTVRMSLDVEGHIAGAPGNPVDTGLHDVARVERAAERFDLKSEQTVAVPPLCVLESIGRRLLAESEFATPAAVAERRIIEVVDRLVRRLDVLHQRHH